MGFIGPYVLCYKSKVKEYKATYLFIYLFIYLLSASIVNHLGY